MALLQEYLDRLERLSQFSMPFSDAWVFGKQKKNYPIICITCLVHGNEWGPLPAIVELAESLASGQISYNGEIRIALGNRQAALQSKRFIEYDLNRIFLKGDHLKSTEGKRAQDLMKLIDGSDLFLDFHQTIQASEKAFYVMAHHEASVWWAQYLEGIDTLVTQNPEESFSPQSRCSDEWAQERNIPSLSIELWQKGFDVRAENLCSSLIKQVLKAPTVLFTDQEQLKMEAQKKRKLRKFWFKHWEPILHPGDRLYPGFKNLVSVDVGQSMGLRNDGTLITAPIGGVLLFPKYPDDEVKGNSIRDTLFVIAQQEI